MTNIAITGAAGSVGRQAIEAFSDADEDEVTLFTHREHDDLESEILEIEDRDAFHEALEGQDVLIHLAANPSPAADWDALSGPNVEGVYNAFEAARENDLQRVVYASSNHAVNMPNVASPIRPESTQGRPTAIRPDDPTRPDSYYGITKVLGEAMGSYYADRHGLEVVNLRIGWLLSADELREEIDQRDGAGERYARAMWLSPDDCERLIDAAATEPLEGTLVTAHGVSDNDDRFLSLTETTLEIDYRPRDNSAAVLDEEGG
ncbi:NAD(P)-dependent oxidoreductase [Halobacteria archaeon AArc-m2/3/4]|uniref:NAD(P)-dependent oxidoreductase n=1 Tax=Natronoglomus mannanivorans TaxID=2979990 RepID=A0AAP3E0J5_9EURY|nr:NAD(P)-dependent oxidoreductase [Halobacteria archaeon AArc-xg1-1]MCU4973157.1 NAD(P)-dependent oxidoreductase [Halobacteria archaeon AArc-m2/3/4]